jgi:hypothetical protein
VKVIEPSRAVLILLAQSYEGGTDVRPHRQDAEPGRHSARSLAKEGRHGIMRDIHKAWQQLYRTDEDGIGVKPAKPGTGNKSEIGGPFLEFVQELWVEAGLDPPPARQVRKIITGH